MLLEGFQGELVGLLDHACMRASASPALSLPLRRGVQLRGVPAPLVGPRLPMMAWAERELYVGNGMESREGPSWNPDPCDVGAGATGTGMLGAGAIGTGMF